MTDATTNVPDPRRKPVFFAWTRSFWSAVLTALLMIEELGEPMVAAVATPLALLFSGSPEVWTGYGVTMLPLITLGYAIHQRSGSSRPYTMTANRETFS